MLGDINSHKSVELSDVMLNQYYKILLLLCALSYTCCVEHMHTDRALWHYKSAKFLSSTIQSKLLNSSYI